MRAKPSVLVIDDNAEALNTFTGVLSALGIEAICRVESAEEALEALAGQKFSLIVADDRMAGMDEAEFVERVRARGDTTPIIFLSGAPDQAGVLRASQYQHVDFAGKPFRIFELLNAREPQFAEAA